MLFESDHPSVIILHSDHGPDIRLVAGIPDSHYLKARMGILSAIYFPDKEYASLYPSMTPVNIYRMVFNKYFGLDLPLLKDRNYFSYDEKPLEFKEVTDRITITSK